MESHGLAVTNHPLVAMVASVAHMMSAHMMSWVWPISGGHDLPKSMLGQGYFSLSGFFPKADFHHGPHNCIMSQNLSRPTRQALCMLTPLYLWRSWSLHQSRTLSYGTQKIPAFLEDRPLSTSADMSSHTQSTSH